MAPLFDYQTLATRLGLPPERVAALESILREQYANDAMMVELRMLRTLRAIEEGVLTLEQAIAEFSPDSPSLARRA